MSWKSLYPKAPSRSKQDLRVRKIYKSWLPTKKLVVRVRQSGRDELVHFGRVGYSDYTEHKDRERRQRFLARMKKVKTKDGKYAYRDPFSLAHWAVKILW